MYFIFVVILAEETPKSPGGTGNVSTVTTDAIIDITVLIFGVVVIAVFGQWTIQYMIQYQIISGGKCNLVLFLNTHQFVQSLVGLKVIYMSDQVHMTIALTDK